MCLLMFKICEKLDIFHEISIYRRSSPIRDHPLTLVIVKILQQDSKLTVIDVICDDYPVSSGGDLEHSRMMEICKQPQSHYINLDLYN